MDIKNEIELCRTPKQVYNVLKKYGRKIQRDDSDDVGTFSIWIDDVTRIYKPHKRKTMSFQKWQKVQIKYSGVPTFF